jgi:hypothetical protein
MVESLKKVLVANQTQSFRGVWGFVSQWSSDGFPNYLFLFTYWPHLLSYLTLEFTVIDFHMLTAVFFETFYILWGQNIFKFYSRQGEKNRATYRSVFRSEFTVWYNLFITEEIKLAHAVAFVIGVIDCAYFPLAMR